MDFSTLAIQTSKYTTTTESALLPSPTATHPNRKETFFKVIELGGGEKWLRAVDIRKQIKRDQERGFLRTVPMSGSAHQLAAIAEAESAIGEMLAEETQESPVVETQETPVIEIESEMRVDDLGLQMTLTPIMAEQAALDKVTPKPQTRGLEADVNASYIVLSNPLNIELQWTANRGEQMRIMFKAGMFGNFMDWQTVEGLKEGFIGRAFREGLTVRKEGTHEYRLTQGGLDWYKANNPKGESLI